MLLMTCKMSIVVAMVLLLGSIVQGFFVRSYSRGLQHKRGDSAKRKLGPKLFFKKNSIPPPTTVVRLHKPVTLTCEAAGVPSPTIHWLYNDERIKQAEHQKYTDDTAYYEDKTDRSGKKLLRMSASLGELHIDCADENDQGIYSCIAETPYQRIFTTTKLMIEENSAESESEACPDREKRNDLIPAHIYMWSKNRLEFEGATVQLFCRAEGMPVPYITWSGTDRKEIDPEDSDYEILGNGDLLVKNIAWKKNMGRFTCRADNGLGVDKATTFLYPTVRD